MNKLKTLAQITPNLIAMFDENKRIKFANKAFLQLTESSPEDIVGKKISSIEKLGNYGKEIEKLLDRVFNTGKMIRHEVNLRDDFWVDCTIVPDQDENGNVKEAFSIGRDITEQKEMQKRLLRLTKELEQQVKERTIELQEQNKFLRKEIKQRKLTEKKLTEQNKLYDLVVNSSGDGILLANVSGKIVFCNNSSPEIFGFKTKEEFRAVNFFKHFAEKGKREIVEQLKTAARNNFFLRDEFKMKKKTGESFFAEVTLNPIMNEAGEFDGFLALVKDVTATRLNKIKLINNERKYKTLFELSPNGILIQDLEGNIVDANQKACEILEVSGKEYLKSIFNFVFPGEEQQARENIQRMVKGQKLHHTVKNFTAKGRIVTLELNEQALDLGDGGRFIITTIKDLTDMLSAETELFQKEALYASLFNASPLPILLEDSSGNILKANKAAEEVFGYSRDEIVGKHISLLSPDKDQIKIKGDISKILDGKVLLHKVKTLTKDGAVRDFELHEVSVPLENGEPGILVIYKDITDVVEREKKLREAKELIEKNAEFKANFFSQMTHEIRSPINIILNFFNLLKEELEFENNELVSTSFDAIESAGKRILHTLENILRMSELRANLYEPNYKIISLADEIMPVLVKEYGRLSEIRGLKFNYFNESRNSKIKGDYYSVLQLFSNLLDNSVKYTKKGGITLSLKNDSRFVTVTIEDTGIGMDEEYLAQIFEAFTREKEVKEENIEGTGLGMALVQKYCQINNAVIDVESEKGKGSKFTVKFPLVK